MEIFLDGGVKLSVLLSGNLTVVDTGFVYSKEDFNHTKIISQKPENVPSPGPTRSREGVCQLYDCRLNVSNRDVIQTILIN